MLARSLLLAAALKPEHSFSWIKFQIRAGYTLTTKSIEPQQRSEKRGKIDSSGGGNFEFHPEIKLVPFSFKGDMTFAIKQEKKKIIESKPIT